ncbi:hypothetical protein LT493_36450 [Streptomyces tricolor]|nr:hypothetical protein [Streptomyces tricolor]
MRLEDVGIATAPARRRVAAAPRGTGPARGRQHHPLHPPGTGPRGRRLRPVLDAVARTLRLTEDETAHLKDLPGPPARPRPAAPRAPHAAPRPAGCSPP